MTPTVDKVIVDEAACLHMGIHYCAANEFETPGNKILAESVRLGSGGRDSVWNCMPVDDGLPPYKSPDIVAERTEFRLDFQKSFSIIDCSGHF